MPIYAYRCGACGHSQDVLQKLSDAPLTQCPACGQASYAKQLTAAGFQLKGSGWYATDFKGGAATAPTAAAQSDAKPDAKPDAAAPAAATSTATAAAPAASGGCGGGCACH